MEGIKLICNGCKKEYSVFLYRKNLSKFCSRSCLGKSKIGAKNSCWKGGKNLRKDGYIMVYIPKHPYQHNNYVMEHRIVMESVIGRFLKPNEKVHHINGIKNDNKKENLILVSQSEHLKIHRLEGTVVGKNWTGLKMSEKTRKKMSESAKKAWLRRRATI